MRNVFVAVLGTAALVVAGCGDDDKKSDSSSGDSQALKTEYIAQADNICRDVKKASKPYSDQLGKLERNDELTQLAPILKGGLREARKGRTRLRALPAPSQDKAALDAYLAQADKTLDLARQLEQATRANDAARTRKLIKDNEGVNERQKQLATQYGFKVCGLN